MLEQIIEIYTLVSKNELLLIFTNIIQIVGSLSITGLGLYFTFQKIGNNIIAFYTIQSDSLTIPRIGEVVLINKKNKPVIINSIHAIFDKKNKLELEKFESPLILKPLESIHIKTNPISKTFLEGLEYEIPFADRSRIEIQIVSIDKQIKCTLLKRNRMFIFSMKKKYTPIKKMTERFNNIVYSDRVIYAIVYNFNSQNYTAFIHRGGAIIGDWIFRINMIPNNHLKSRDTITEYIKSLNLTTGSFNFSVEKLN